MSLFRFLSLSVIGLLLLWALLMARSQIMTLRDSIQEQMQANLETAVTSLGLVLQGAFLGGDPVMAETMVNAMFDGGYVRSIQLVDPDGKVIFKREFTAPVKAVPDWLPEYVAFPTQRVTQEITDGWNILGTVAIEGHSSYGYAFLWQAMRQQVMILGGGMVVVLLLIGALLLLLLHPMRAVIRRIVAMSGNHLPSTIPLSFWSELRQLDEAVNRLIQEKRRNHERRKLKLLRWRLALQGEHLDTPPPPVGDFVSTQGQLVLYRQSNAPDGYAGLTALPELWQCFEAYWRSHDAVTGQGRRIPLALIGREYGAALLALLRKGRPGVIEWFGRPANDDGAAALLKSLRQLGYEHVLTDFGASRQDYQWLEWMRPRWVICSWQSALPAQYWILQNVTLHDLGIGVLVHGCDNAAVLLELEFNGYLVTEAR